MLRRKPYFDARVALELGIGQKFVRKVTRAFLSELAAALSDLDEVQLDGLGRFRTTVRKHAVTMRLPKKSRTKIKNSRLVLRQYRVNFQKASVIGDLLRTKHGPSIEET